MIPNELVFTPVKKAVAEENGSYWVLIYDAFDKPSPTVIQAEYVNRKFVSDKLKTIPNQLILGICPIDKKAFDVEKCTIAELSSARRNLENELREIICKSGLPISNVSVNLHEGTTVSDTARRYFCSGVDIELSV